jgi:hypothetical protein
MDYARLRDSYPEANPGDAGITVSSEIPYIAFHAPERIDYLLYRSSHSQALGLIGAQLAFHEVDAAYAGEILAYSDHYGVQATFELSDTAGENPAEAGRLASESEILTALEQGSERSQRAERASQLQAGLSVLIALVLLLLLIDKQMDRRQFLKIMLAGLTCLIGLYGGVQIFSATQVSRQIKTLEEILREVKEEGA